MRRIVCAVFLVAIVFGGFATAEAGDHAPVLSKIVESGKLRVGTSGTQPPYTVVSNAGEVIGFEMDLAEFLADAMGVELVIVQKPFNQLLAALEKGEVDMVMSGMTMTPERNLTVFFVGPYHVTGKSILTTSAKLAAIQDVEELDVAKLRFAALKGSTSEYFVKDAMPKAQLMTTEDYDEAVAKLLADEVDGVVADFPKLAITALRHPDKGFALGTRPLSIEPIGVALPPGDPLLANVVENYLGALEDVGVLDELDEIWFEDGSWLARIP
jgi:polar amino acid transport system substrate-binding protein